MHRAARALLACLTILVAAAPSARAADLTNLVRVALLDASSVMPAGGMGYGMGYGMMGQNMMGGMMTIRTDRQSVQAGAVTFEVTNWSRSMLHEMLVVAVDNPSAPLPYDYARAIVPEAQVKLLGEASDMQPNGTSLIEVTLAPGWYLLLCNLPGHYASGMAAALNVTP
jgi:uncharacterized cupredoxin-like copper-binding protein